MLTKLVRRTALTVSLGALILVSLFLWNGSNEGWKAPDFGQTGVAPNSEPVDTVRVLTFNIAKCFALEGGLSFASEDEVRARLDQVAALIEREHADLVYLTEVVNECAPCPIDQAEYLARKCGFASWASSDNYRFGVPGIQIRAGNALLSKFPMRVLETTQLAGERPCWSPTNNRRALWCTIRINGTEVLTASLRNDSFDLANNERQTKEVLSYIDGRRSLLAGDFNAEPHNASIALLRESEFFAGEFHGPATFPAHAPKRCIDYVLAPHDWRLLEHRVIQSSLSDHLPVLAVFAPPTE